ncbi:MAG: hypothetical protein MI784_13445 [Cytophagales bacterium]|nr:hypothetical protein [Cytophagales bacterium]
MKTTATDISKKSKLNKTIYDNAKNHFLGNFPEHLPIEQAYVHIGMYLGWIIEQELYSDFFEEEASTEIYRFKRRELPCTILSEIWDGYLGYELFSEKGNMFTYYYYASGLFHKDYLNNLAKELPSIYHVDDSWENYSAIAELISKRYQEWQALIQ